MLPLPPKYKKKKERLQEMTCEKYRNSSKEEKGKKWEYECKQYKNLPEDQKQRLAELEKFTWEALEKKTWRNTSC